MPVAIGDQAVPKTQTRRDGRRVSHSVQIPPSVSPSTKARENLSKSLHEEIAKGDVTVEQIGDTVTISLNDLVNQLEYESGQAQVKPSGIKILKQISEYLKQDTENEILVEGHTDNQPIGPTLVKQYPTNQELSEARADLMVRYFIDAGIDPSSLAAIGYADTRPAEQCVGGRSKAESPYPDRLDPETGRRTGGAQVYRVTAGRADNGRAETG